MPDNLGMFRVSIDLMSKKKTLTLSHQLSSAFWRLSAEPVRWSLWSGTAAEDVLRTDVSTDVSVGEYGMIQF